MRELPITWPTLPTLTPVDRARALTTDASMTPAAARVRSSAASGSKVPAASDLRSVERWDR